MRNQEAGAFVISAKMARALASTWRGRILMELSVRPMSPSQFVKEVGGELSEISRCFRQLASWDYIELAEERVGRRGTIEHVYRQTQRAHLDTATWERLPRPHRDAFSGSIFGSYAARVSEAVELGTFDDEIDRHLSWTGALLDRRSWKQLMAALDEVLDWVPTLEAESARRMAASGEEAIPTTIGLAAFRSPNQADMELLRRRRRGRRPSTSCSSSPMVISPKMAKAAASKWRSRVLMELSVRPMSPSQFVKEVGGTLGHISRCFVQLAEWEYVELVEERRGGHRRGAVEHVYISVQPALFDTETWKTLPRFLRDEFSGSILGSYFSLIAEAIIAGSFDAEPDRHFSWAPAALDRQAWKALGARLDQILDWLPQLEEEATNRLARNSSKPIPTIAGLAAFRSPKQSEISRGELSAEPGGARESRPTSLRRPE